jgi:uncharacterized protein YxeA
MKRILSAVVAVIFSVTFAGVVFAANPKPDNYTDPAKQASKAKVKTKPATENPKKDPNYGKKVEKKEENKGKK